MNGNTLYIIGNGFDLHHGMKTKYSDFHVFVEKNHHDLENFLENYFLLKTNNNYLWKDFEYDLGSYDSISFFNDSNDIDPMSENFKPSYCYCLEDSITQDCEDYFDLIKKAFSNWIFSVQEEFSSQYLLHKLLSLDRDAIYLSFNYTNTLEALYKIKKENILYIHNNVIDNGEEIILGHNVEPEFIPDIDENGEVIRTMFTDSENAAKKILFDLKKQTSEIIENNNLFFLNLNDISEIIILGHSINEIDLPYYKRIFNTVGELATWRVSYFFDDEKLKHKKALKSIGVKESNIILFKMKDLEALFIHPLLF